MVPFSQFLTRLVWPIQYVVNLPSQMLEVAQPLLDKHNDWTHANNELQREHIYLQAQVQKLRALEAENQELRELLRSVAHNKESFSEGRLIHTDVDPFTQQILLNKGHIDGIEVGQPVIDAFGLVGLVLGVNQYNSRVLLATDPSFAVPVQSVRSGERAIAVGSGSGGELRLNYVPRTADFIEGDVLVTSGLGGRFPAGYPVGTITSIQHDTSTRFTLIGISPSAKLGQLRHVLFVKHHPQAGSETTVAKLAKPQALAQNTQSATDLEKPIPKQQVVESVSVPPIQTDSVEVKKPESSVPSEPDPEDPPVMPEPKPEVAPAPVMPEPKPEVAPAPVTPEPKPEVAPAPVIPAPNSAKTPEEHPE